MNKPKRNERKAIVQGISTDAASKKYALFISNEFKVFDVSDSGKYVLLHKRIRFPERRFVDVILYTTDTIYISGSPHILQDEFGRIATRIIQLAQQATTPLEQKRPLSIQRAKNILDFANKLSLENEYERMVQVILADTCNEIVLREQMKAANIEGAPLDEGVPDKIKRLEDKGYAVMNEEQIKNLRELRNRIVHYGDVPDKTQTIEALKIAKNLVEQVSAT